ncbi:hypothetical protein BpHYR1_042913, partial [Brachionus plicatilis]
TIFEFDYKNKNKSNYCYEKLFLPVASFFHFSLKFEFLAPASTNLKKEERKRKGRGKEKERKKRGRGKEEVRKKRRRGKEKKAMKLVLSCTK